MVYFYTVFRDSIYADSIVKYLCLFYSKIYDLILIIKGCNLGCFSGQFFHIFEIHLVCFVVALFDLVPGVESIFHLP